MTKDKIKIIIQHFHGCPNGPKMIENVEKAIAGLEDQIEYSEQLIDTQKLAVQHSFRGSPTLLINGEDFEGMPVPANPGLTCRFYSGGLPQAEEIRKKIRDAK